MNGDWIGAEVSLRLRVQMNSKQQTSLDSEMMWKLWLNNDLEGSRREISGSKGKLTGGRFACTEPNCVKVQINFGKYSEHWASVQFSRSVVSDSLWHHESQHARPPCPSPTPRVHSNSCPSSQWCHPAISSSVAPFSSCPQSLPTSGSFPLSWLFASGG